MCLYLRLNFCVFVLDDFIDSDLLVNSICLLKWCVIDNEIRGAWKQGIYS